MRIDPSPTARRLHVGCGRTILAGWINLDIEPFEGVDLVTDASRDLGYRDVEATFAEHFLEHLRIDAAVDFLEQAFVALGAGGWMRVSTPNLEWVLASHYDPSDWGEKRAINALLLNRAFHGWGHQFLWNRDALTLALHATGFVQVRFCKYGESELPVFRGLERHEQYPDLADQPHVLIAEATRGAARPEALARLRSYLGREYLAHLHPVPGSMTDAE